MNRPAGKIARTYPRARVVLIGAGAWGTTLALVAHRAGAETVLASHSTETAAFLRERRVHPRSITGVRIPDEIQIVTFSEVAPTLNDIVILAIPVQKLRSALSGLRERLTVGTIVSAAKGIELGSLLTPSAILGEILDDGVGGRLVVLSGPNLAPEIAAGQPATTVVASSSVDTAIRVQQTLNSGSFRVYTSRDVVGVELGGALKNIIAIGAGIADGLRAGHNAKAAFMTRGIAEIARIGIARGAEPLTFAGLSGIGDLIATCGSSLSRNHTVGRGLAEGRSLEEIVASMSETAEGIDTTRAANELAQRLWIDAPVIRGMYGVLFEGRSPIEAAAELMNREPTTENISGS